MAVWNSSSLAFSDHNKMRNDSGLLGHTKGRISKQHLVEHKMFGPKRKGIQIGKKFKKSNKKDTGGTKSMSAKMDKMGKGVSPSLAEFDKMMSSIAGGSSKNSKRLAPSRKSFD